MELVFMRQYHRGDADVPQIPTELSFFCSSAAIANKSGENIPAHQIECGVPPNNSNSDYFFSLKEL